MAAILRKSKTRADYRNYFPEIVTARNPDWIVLRNYESQVVQQIDSDLLTKYYRLVKVFDCRDRIDAIKVLPGRYRLLFDSHFEVYRRAELPPPTRGGQLA